ncbi:hypothetical protein ACFX13_002703 [Malus domestica]
MAATVMILQCNQKARRLPRKIDDKLVADDPISTPASMSIHDAVGDTYSNNNRCNHIRTCYCFLQRKMKSR